MQSPFIGFYFSRRFYNAYGLPFLSVGLAFSIVETLNRCAQPLFLGALLSNFVDADGSKQSAYFYASGIVLCSFIPVITFHPFIYYVFEIGMKLRVGCSRLVYDKVKCLPEHRPLTFEIALDGLNFILVQILLRRNYEKQDLKFCYIFIILAFSSLAVIQ